MRRVFGPRTLVEALFLIAVPIVALAGGLGWIGIVIASAAAYGVVLVVEATVARAARPQARVPSAPAPAAPEAPAEDAVRVLPPSPAPETAVVRAEPVPEPVVQPDPEPVAAEPEPAPALAAVPDLPPEPEQEAEPEPAAPVVHIAAFGPPRQWNVWELEQVARGRVGANPERDQERTYLLMYLREFADANGMLSVDFDSLVRDAFGELVFT